MTLGDKIDQAIIKKAIWFLRLTGASVLAILVWAVTSEVMIKDHERRIPRIESSISDMHKSNSAILEQITAIRVSLAQLQAEMRNK